MRFLAYYVVYLLVFSAIFLLANLANAQSLESYIYLDQNPPKEIYIAGDILDTTYDAIITLDLSNVERISINSPGGDMRSAHNIADLVTFHGWDTHVKGICYSACILISSAGDIRTAEPYSNYMMHMPFEDRPQGKIYRPDALQLYIMILVENGANPELFNWDWRYEHYMSVRYARELGIVDQIKYIGE